MHKLDGTSITWKVWEERKGLRSSYVVESRERMEGLFSALRAIHGIDSDVEIWMEVVIVDFVLRQANSYTGSVVPFGELEHLM